MMRSQRGVVWPYLVLSVALLGALSFGWYQTNQKNRLALVAENKYMSAFHKLKWTSENIEERTARLLATGDRNLQESLLADLRVYSAQAVEHMSVLPFATMNTPRIENFLNTLRERSDEYHEKVNRGQALTEEEWAHLRELRQQSVFFEKELSNLLGLVGNNRIKWNATVRATSPAQSGAAATPITKSVQLLDRALQPPPGEEGAMAQISGVIAKPKTDPGPRLTPEQAAENLKQFLDMPLKQAPALTGNSDPNDEQGLLSLYFFDLQKANGLQLNAGVSVHGGKVIYLIDGRPVQQKNFTPAQLVQKAREMLAQRGFPSLEWVSSVENDGTYVMDFAPVENGVAVHTDKIQIMLAMDNAELVGYDARNYWINRRPRNLQPAKLSAAEARTRVAPTLQVDGQPRLALVADRTDEERLVWEVRGHIDDQHFQVFVDAATGEEVDLLRVSGDPAPPLGEGQ